MPNDILTRAIDELCAGSHLTADHTSAALAEIMEGRATEVQISAFLIALRAKGETVPELVGLARTMRALAAEVHVDVDGLVDTAGTGGGPTTFNVSTTAALIAAAAGCKVAKHGNRSATSRSGSADVLEALGVAIELTPEQVATCIDEVGFGFMFAPKHHKATAHVVPVRKELAVRTIFNFLGPLTNPAGAEPPAPRGFGPQLPGDDRRGPDRPRLRARAGRLGRQRNGRAGSRPDPRDRGVRRGHRGVVRRARGLRPPGGVRSSRLPEGSPPRTPRSPERSSPASRAPLTRSRC